MGSTATNLRSVPGSAGARGALRGGVGGVVQNHGSTATNLRSVPGSVGNKMPRRTVPL